MQIPIKEREHIVSISASWIPRCLELLLREPLPGFAGNSLGIAQDTLCGDSAVQVGDPLGANQVPANCFSKCFYVLVRNDHLDPSSAIAVQSETNAESRYAGTCVPILVAIEALSRRGQCKLNVPGCVDCQTHSCGDRPCSSKEQAEE